MMDFRPTRRTVRRGGPHLPIDGVPHRENRTMKMWANEPRGATARKLYASSLDAIGAIDAISDREVEAVKSRKFTEAGVKQDVYSFAANKHAKTFARNRAAIAAAKREAERLSEKLTLQPADKTDFVGAIKRMEMRGWLANFPADERNKYLARNLEQLDPEMALAIVEAPPEMTGVAESSRDLLRERALHALHGADAIAEVEELKVAIETAESINETARDEVRQIVNVAHDAFDETMSKFESVAPTPWLRKDGDKVVVVDLEKKVARAASAEEIASGEFFADFETYKRANGGVAA